MSAGQSFGSVIFAKASAVSSKQEVWFPVIVRTESVAIRVSSMMGCSSRKDLDRGVLQTQLGYQPTTNVVGMAGI